MWCPHAGRTTRLAGCLLHSCAERASYHSSTARLAPLASSQPSKRRPVVTAPPLTTSLLLSPLDDEPLVPRQEQLRRAKQQADERKQAHRTQHLQHRLSKQHHASSHAQPHAASHPGQRQPRHAGNDRQRGRRTKPSNRGEFVSPLHNLVATRHPSFIPAATMPPLLATALRPIVNTTQPRMLAEVTAEPYWTAIPPLDSLHFDRFGSFTPPSRDHTLLQLAASAGLPVAASTSSSTPPLSHCTYAIVGREGAVDVSLLGDDFADMRRSFTFTATAPVSVILRRRWVDEQGNVVARHVSLEEMEAGEAAQDGLSGLTAVWAVDRLQGARERTTILSELGQAMERMLTMEPDEFQSAFIKPPADTTTSSFPSPSSSPFRPPAQQYSYLSTGTSLIRAQLDCHDPSLTSPPSPVFDIKTRATHAIRYNLHRYEEQLDYHITKQSGLYNSFEREYYDMGRSAFLKYVLQCRIGGMQGVMVAYHNTQRVFGLQMIAVAEMERLILGQHAGLLGDKVYAASLQLLDNVYRRVAERVQAEAQRLRHSGVGGVEDAIKVTLSRNAWDEERTMSVYVELSGRPQDDYDAHLPFAQRHHTVWRLDVLDLPGLQSVAAAHGLTALAATTDRAALLVELENALYSSSTRNPPSVEHVVALIASGRLVRYRVKVQHTVDGRLIERWNELAAEEVARLQTSFEVREQRAEEEAQARRMATEYRQALLEGRLHQEEEVEKEWEPKVPVEKAEPTSLVDEKASVAHALQQSQ
ncbi:hypothetical protein MMC34_008256 [Xylographa carneopallida]|nr:hypothetical protein [Xylographa carneopallida]